MKNIIYCSLLGLLLLCAGSCDKGLEELNRNTTDPTTIDPVLLLNNAVINTSFPVKSLVFDIGIGQQMVTPNGGVLAGANFNQDSRDVTTPALWVVYYENVIKYTHDVIVKTKSDAARSNLLLLAEAAFRGWISSGTAAQYFSDGIKAHMDQMATYDAGCTVAPGDRNTYVAANPLSAGTELEQINTQYWIASFLNGPEAFANFRRSGFPALTPNPYGQPNNPDVPNGTFIRRLTYPTAELSVNTDNVNAAIAAQGADKLSTRIWWDK